MTMLHKAGCEGRLTLALLMGLALLVTVAGLALFLWDSTLDVPARRMAEDGIERELAHEVKPKPESHDQRLRSAEESQGEQRQPERAAQDDRGERPIVPPQAIPRSASGIGELLDRIPPTIKPDGIDRVSRITIVNAPLANVVRRIRMNFGTRINFESAPDGPTLVNVVAQNLTVEELLHHIVKQNPRYKLSSSRSGWRLHPKGSPMSKTKGRYRAIETSPGAACGRLVQQIQNNIGGGFQVAYVDKGVASLPSGKVRVSVTGNAYDALDGLLRDVPGMTWDILWRGNRAWIRLSPTVQRKSENRNSLTVVGASG